MTPHDRHTGKETKILLKRKFVYQQAKKKHPERWSGDIKNWNPEKEFSLTGVSKIHVKELLAKQAA